MPSSLLFDIAVKALTHTVKQEKLKFKDLKEGNKKYYYMHTIWLSAENSNLKSIGINKRVALIFIWGPIYDIIPGDC